LKRPNQNFTMNATGDGLGIKPHGAGPAWEALDLTSDGDGGKLWIAAMEFARWELRLLESFMRLMTPTTGR